MNKTARDYLKEPYSRTLIPAGDGTYFAEILEFRGCFAEGQTPNEAYANLERVAESWIEAAIEQKQEIPSPLATRDFSGRVALRIPRSIHSQAVKFAEMDGTSLNQFFLASIAARVGAEEFYERLSNKLEAKCMAFATTMPSYTINLHTSLWATGPVKMMTAKISTPALLEKYFIPLAPSGMQMAISSGQFLVEKEAENG